MSDSPFSIDVGGGETIEISGWDALESEAAEKLTSTQFQAELDHCTLYRQCFASTAGRYVLKDLIDTFFKQRIVEALDPPGSLLPGIRQGQADVVIRIFRMIEFANTGGKQTGAGVITED